MTPNKITRNVKHRNELQSSVGAGEAFQKIVGALRVFHSMVGA